MECDLAAGPEFSLERVGCGPITDWDLEYFRLKMMKMGVKLKKYLGFIASRAAARALDLPEAWLLSLQ